MREYLSAGECHRRKLELQRKWRARNIEKVRAYGREGARRRRVDFPEKVREYRRKEYLKNRDYYIKKSKAWRIANRIRYNAKCSELYKKRMAWRRRPKCMGCECILKENESLVCSWCLYTYPYKYANINLNESYK